MAILNFRKTEAPQIFEWLSCTSIVYLWTKTMGYSIQFWSLLLFKFLLNSIPKDSNNLIIRNGYLGKMFQIQTLCPLDRLPLCVFLSGDSTLLLLCPWNIDHCGRPHCPNFPSLIGVLLGVWKWHCRLKRFSCVRDYCPVPAWVNHSLSHRYWPSNALFMAQCLGDIKDIKQATYDIGLTISCSFYMACVFDIKVSVALKTY